MRKLLTLLAILISVQAAFGDVRLVMVDGYCYLEGQSEHSDTKVKFIKVSPSAIADSTYTDSSGYFSITDLYEGIYDIEYSHSPFVNVVLEDQILVGNETLSPVTLRTHVSGVLNGILGPGVYHVVDTISVSSGNSLRLLPGTTFIFDGPYPFYIYGTLMAEGTESDSVIFTTEQSGENRWRSLRFHCGSSGSRLYHCLIEKGYATGSGPNYNGAGVYCTSSSPKFFNCTISGNSAVFGGALHCDNSSPSFTNCTLSGNSAFYGSGVSCQSSSPTFTSCAISNNFASQSGGGVICDHSSPTFTNCTLSSNSASQDGGGMYCQSSSPTFTNCTLSGNSATHRGGGVYNSSSSPTFTNCAISGNSAQNEGGGMHCSNSSSDFTNCTISGNSADDWGGGVYCSNSSLTFTNCTLSGNSASHGGGVFCYSSWPAFKSSIIAFSSGSGIYFQNSASSQISYCDIFGNSGGNIIFWSSPSDGPPLIGQLFVTNANADSADIYMNIFVDPMFPDTAAGDYHLTDFSHCIGAGDPASTVSTDFEGDLRPNPSWSFPDIGADEHWSGSPVLHLVVSMVSGNARLNWTPFGAGPYSIYGATEPFAVGTLLATVSDTTTWTDEEAASRPWRYFYYMMAEWPGR